METFLSIINMVFLLYFGAGFVLAWPLSFVWLPKTDAAAKDAHLLFRLIIMPGLWFFWPLFAVRLISGKGIPSEVNEHRRRAAAPAKDCCTEGGRP